MGIKLHRLIPRSVSAYRSGSTGPAERCGTKYHHNHQGLDCSHGFQGSVERSFVDPQCHRQPVWVVTVLKAVTGWSEC